MSDMELYQSGSGGAGGVVSGFSPSPWTRQGRAVSRVLGGTELAVARTAAAAHVEQARMDAIDAVASRGLQGVAMTSQVEQQLATMVPFAASRLQAIGDMHAFLVASEVLRFGRGL